MFPTLRFAFTRAFLIATSISALQVAQADEMSCDDLAIWLSGLPGIETDPVPVMGGVRSDERPPGIFFVNYRCELDFFYSSGETAGYAPGEQERIGLRIGLPLNSIDAEQLPDDIETRQFWQWDYVPWNGKIQNLGGGGLVGSLLSVTNATNGGYVGSFTDSGHTADENAYGFQITDSMGNPLGRLDTGQMKDFQIDSLVAQYEWAAILAQAYYGMEHTHNYWNGCSTGGRQGLALAIEHGEDFDGFLIGAPAIYGTRFAMSAMWHHFVNSEIAGDSLTPDKVIAANDAAIAACDAGTDGVVDGLISDYRKCDFEAHTGVCFMDDGEQICLTQDEADAINKIWEGPHNDRGTRIWVPYTERGTFSSVLSLPFGDIYLGFASSFVNEAPTCGPLCTSHLDPNFDWRNPQLVLSDFDDEWRLSTNLVGPHWDTMSPELFAAQASGAKIVLWHGAADWLVPPGNSVQYYNEVVDAFGSRDAVDPWFRFFMAPGVSHCGGGYGHQPQSLFDTLVNWVETEPDNPPESVDGVLAPNFFQPDLVNATRPICAWPQEAQFIGDDVTDPDQVNSAEYWECGGNVETKETVCLGLVAPYQQETLKATETNGRANPAVCNPNSNVPLDKPNGRPDPQPRGRGR
jgi:hypothetical protein